MRKEVFEELGRTVAEVILHAANTSSQEPNEEGRVRLDDFKQDGEKISLPLYDEIVTEFGGRVHAPRKQKTLEELRAIVRNRTRVDRKGVAGRAIGDVMSHILHSQLGHLNLDSHQWDTFKMLRNAVTEEYLSGTTHNVQTITDRMKDLTREIQSSTQNGETQSSKQSAPATDRDAARAVNAWKSKLIGARAQLQPDVNLLSAAQAIYENLTCEPKKADLLVYGDQVVQRFTSCGLTEAGAATLYTKITGLTPQVTPTADTVQE